jgi:hypothetical protein
MPTVLGREKRQEKHEGYRGSREEGSEGGAGARLSLAELNAMKPRPDGLGVFKSAFF